MPRAIISQKSTDSVFLQSWIRDALRQHDPRLSDNIIPALSEQDFEHPEMSSSVLNDLRHFAKITKFFKVDHSTIYASIRDSKVQLLS